MQESGTSLAILEEGEERCARNVILIVGEARLGTPPESARAQVNAVTDLACLKRMVRCAATAATWQEILDTP